MNEINPVQCKINFRTTTGQEIGYITLAPGDLIFIKDDVILYKANITYCPSAEQHFNSIFAMYCGMLCTKNASRPVFTLMSGDNFVVMGLLSIERSNTFVLIDDMTSSIIKVAI